MLCDFSEGLACKRCGYVAKRQQTYRECRTLDEMAEYIVKTTTPPWVPIPNPMLGDRVANALAYVGVTKERVQQITGAKDCGCAGRQKGLNFLSGVVAKTVERVIDAAATAVIGEREEPGRLDLVRAALLQSPDTNPGVVAKATASDG